MFSLLVHGLGKSFHFWLQLSLPHGRKFSSSAPPEGTCDSPKSNYQPGSTEEKILSSAFLGTTGAASKSPTTRADQLLILLPWSARYQRRNWRMHAAIFACVFRRWPTLRWLKAGCASTRIPQTTISSWIAIPV